LENKSQEREKTAPDDSARLVGLAFVAAAFGVGYLARAGKDHLEDAGGLGTAQRNTAAGIILPPKTSATIRMYS